MVAEYGMSDKVGPLSLGREDPNPFLAGSRTSEATAKLIDDEVARLLNEAHDEAERILNDHRDLLDRLSALLLVVETIDGDDLDAYAAGTKPIPDPETVRQQLPAPVPAAPQSAASERLPAPTAQTPPMPAIE
jgi:cell division protease FtsH